MQQAAAYNLTRTCFVVVLRSSAEYLEHLFGFRLELQMCSDTHVQGRTHDILGTQLLGTAPSIV